MATQRTSGGEPALARAARNISGSFPGEVWAELKKVVWPTREEATRLTTLVITVSVAVGVVLGLIDVGFEQLVRWIV